MEKTIKLLPGSREAFIFSATDTQTVIHYKCPAWPGKTCIYSVPGKWEIKKEKANKITLVNHDVIFNEINPY